MAGVPANKKNGTRAIPLVRPPSRSLLRMTRWRAYGSCVCAPCAFAGKPGLILGVPVRKLRTRAPQYVSHILCVISFISSRYGCLHLKCKRCSLRPGPQSSSPAVPRPSPTSTPTLLAPPSLLQRAIVQEPLAIIANKPAIAQLVEHLTVECCSNQMVPGSIPGGRIISSAHKK